MALTRFSSLSRVLCAVGFVALSAYSASSQKTLDNETATNKAPTVREIFYTPISNGSDNNKSESSKLTRVGVQQADTLSLSLQDAITRALQNNNDIEVSRTDMRISEQSIRAQLGFYDPVFTLNPTFTRNSTTGNAATKDFSANANISQNIRPGGGDVTAYFNNTRTENAFAQAQVSSGNISAANTAIYSSNLGVRYNQPLMRNFKIDNTRRQVKILKKRLEQSDIDFKLQSINIITNVQTAYWNLVLALRNQQNRVENVDLARENLRQIMAKISAGASAPLEKAQVETELATREGDLLLAAESVTNAENALKQLIIKEPTAPEWTRSIVPTDKPGITSFTADLDRSINDAIENRFELKRLKLEREVNALDIIFYKNQTKPQIDLNTSFSLAGLSRGGTSTASTLVPLYSGIDEIFRTRLNSLLPANQQIAQSYTTVEGTPSYLAGGFNRSWANLFRSDAPNYSVGVTISFPFRNRTAKANLASARITSEKLAAQTRSQEQQVIVDVRNAVQRVDTARRRVDTARRAREAAEVQLDGEQKLFNAGRSTTFLLFQRENTLASARIQEITAETDYNKAVADLQRVTATSFEANNIVLDSPVDIK